MPNDGYCMSFKQKVYQVPVKSSSRFGISGAPTCISPLAEVTALDNPVGGVSDSSLLVTLCSTLNAVLYVTWTPGICICVSQNSG